MSIAGLIYIAGRREYMHVKIIFKFYAVYNLLFISIIFQKTSSFKEKFHHPVNYFQQGDVI